MKEGDDGGRGQRSDGALGVESGHLLVDILGFNGRLVSPLSALRGHLQGVGSMTALTLVMKNTC